MPKVNPYFLTNCESESLENLEVEIKVDSEVDEFWSYVQNKGNQRWTWYAIDRNSGIILAWHNGKRTDNDFLVLWLMLSQFPVKNYYTDDWGAYSRHIPAHMHKVGKENTWKIERKNLNFRTHIKRLHRKTICFSKNEQIHDNVIGMYINRYYFKTGLFANAA
jgi:insertion element IS1 protein InsB